MLLTLQKDNHTGQFSLFWNGSAYLYLCQWLCWSSTVFHTLIFSEVPPLILPVSNLITSLSLLLITTFLCINILYFHTTPSSICGKHCQMTCALVDAAQDFEKSLYCFSTFYMHLNGVRYMNRWHGCDTHTIRVILFLLLQASDLGHQQFC